MSILLVAGLGVTAGPAEAAPKPRRYPNCRSLNAVYPHGVAKKGARDHTSGRPVRTFRVDTQTYRLNVHLDRDHDGIACEKR